MKTMSINRVLLQRLLLACFLVAACVVPAPTARAQSALSAAAAVGRSPHAPAGSFPGGRGISFRPRLAAPTWPPRPDPVQPNPTLEPPQAQAAASCSYSGAEYIRVVFMSYRDVKWEIYLRDGCEYEHPPLRLTNNSAFDGYPRVDSALARIVFVSDRDSNDELYSMDLAGGDLRRLTADPGADAYPAWSPDGQQIVFVSDRGGDPDLYLMSRDGSGAHLLLNMAGLDSDPVWTPDGKQITWVHWTSDSGGRIYNLDVESGTVTPLTGELSSPSRPSWSPDGQYLAFSADLNADSGIDLGWMKLSEGVVNRRSCAYNNHPCDLMVGGFWPEGQSLLANEVTYVQNGASWYVQQAYLTRVNLTCYDYYCSPYAWQNSLLDYAPDCASADTSAPVSRVLPLPAYSPASGFNIRVAASDRGTSGLNSLTVESRGSPGQDWGPSYYQNFPDHPTSVEMSVARVYAGTPGQMIYFRSQASDMAGHTEAAHPGTDTFTRLYSWGALGQVTDQRGRPLDGVQASPNPAALNKPVSGPDGALDVYFAADGTYETILSHPGYTGLPPLSWASRQDINLNYLGVLPSGSNLVPNGQFEDAGGEFSYWETEGDLPIAAGEGHSGAFGAALGPECGRAACFSSAESVPGSPYYLSSAAVTPDGRLHILYTDYYGYTISYLSRGPDGQWSAPQTVYASGGTYMTISNLEAGPAGELAFLTRTYTGPLQVWYMAPGGSWISETVSQSASSNYAVRFDKQGGLHVLYTDAFSRLLYRARGADGAWADARLIDDEHSPTRFDLAPAADGAVHIFYAFYAWGTGYNKFEYLRINPSGEMSAPEILDTRWNDDYSFYLALGTDGRLHVVTTGGPALYFYRDPSTGWSAQTSLANTLNFLDNSNGWILTTGLDPAGNLQIILLAPSKGGRQLMVLVLPAGQESFVLHPLIPDLSGVDFNYPILAGDGALHLLLRQNASWTYQRTQAAEQEQSAGLKQTISIPAGSYKPTLSFLYKLNQYLPAGQSRLEVELVPQEGSSTILLTLGPRDDWTHAWADLSPWQGQTVTLIPRLIQAAGEAPVRLALDEITVSDWTALHIHAVEVSAPQPLTNWWSAPVTVTVRGENFMEGVRVRLGGQEIAATRLSETELTFTLPAGFPPGKYTLVLENPGGALGVAPDPIRLGLQVFLPALAR